MTTQKFKGRNQLVSRLAIQVGSKKTALDILRDRGHIKKNSDDLTKAGQIRDDMTARERALDRAAKASGRPASDFKYDSSVNRARLKKGK